MSRDSTDPRHWDHQCVPRDSVDGLVASWRANRPDLDFSPVAVIARLGRIRDHVDRVLDDVFAAHGLSAADFAVLVTLARIGEGRGVSQRRLMDELALTSGTISVRMDRLAEVGLIERGSDPESKRNTLITLTARGRELFERVVPAHLENEKRLLAALDGGEREVLIGLLRKLLVEFEGSLPPADAPLLLGLTVAPAYTTVAMRGSVGLPPVTGLLVRGVEDDGPAARAGLRPGDVLLRAGRRDLRSIAGLYAAIDDAPQTRRLRVKTLRGIDERMVVIKLGDAGNAIDGAAVAATAGRAARGEHTV